MPESGGIIMPVFFLIILNTCCSYPYSGRPGKLINARKAAALFDDEDETAFSPRKTRSTQAVVTSRATERSSRREIPEEFEELNERQLRQSLRVAGIHSSSRRTKTDGARDAAALDSQEKNDSQDSDSSQVSFN